MSLSSTKNGYKPIPDWPKYIINKEGRVFRLHKTKAPTERNWSFTGKGYAYIHLSDTPRLEVGYIHRLIWTTFKGPIGEGMEIDHINKISDDNRFTNLREVIKQENLYHRWN